MKNLRLIVPVLALVVLILSIFGCGNPTGGGGGGGSVGTGIVYGKVLDQDGAAINNVTVTSSNVDSHTNDTGFFSLDAAAGNNVIVKFSKTGYVATQKSVRLAASNSTYVSVTMRVIGSSGTLDTATGGTCTDTSLTWGVCSVEIPAGALVDSNGDPVTGTYYVDVTGFDASDLSDLNAFPGSFMSSVAGGGRPIETFGFMNVQLNDGAGNIYNLAPGATAEITIPVPASLAGSAPTTIDLWYYDDASSSWKKQGVATRETSGGNTYYIGVVSHFFTWNASELYDYGYIKGRVVNDTGEAVAGAIVYAEGSDYGAITTAITGSDGRFSGLAVPYNSSKSVYAQKGTSTSEALALTDPLDAGDSPYDIGDLIITDESIATVTLQWGEHPHDLDSHLTGPTPEGQSDRFHVSYNDMTPTGADAWLDTDDIDSYGPEITTITKFHPGLYKFSVHNFSKWAFDTNYLYPGQEDVPIDPSSTEVVLTCKAGTYTFHPPISNPTESKTWRVFNINVSASGAISVTTVNSYADPDATDSTDMGVFTVKTKGKK